MSAEPPVEVLGRVFACAKCGCRKRADTLTGPLPTTCSDCDPEGARRRQHDRVVNREAARRRVGELHRLREQVGTLRVELGELKAERRDLRRSRTLLQRKAEQADELRRQRDAALTKVSRLERDDGKARADAAVRQAEREARRAARAEAALRDVKADVVGLRASQPTHAPARLVRLRSLGEPGRDALGRAIRRVATAAGASETAERLLDVAALAEAWADRLVARGPVETGGERKTAAA